MTNSLSFTPDSPISLQELLAPKAEKPLTHILPGLQSRFIDVIMQNNNNLHLFINHYARNYDIQLLSPERLTKQQKKIVCEKILNDFYSHYSLEEIALLPLPEETDLKILFVYVFYTAAAKRAVGENKVEQLLEMLFELDTEEFCFYLSAAYEDILHFYPRFANQIKNPWIQCINEMSRKLGLNKSSQPLLQERLNAYKRFYEMRTALTSRFTITRTIGSGNIPPSEITTSLHQRLSVESFKDPEQSLRSRTIAPLPSIHEQNSFVSESLGFLRDI